MAVLYDCETHHHASAPKNAHQRSDHMVHTGCPKPACVCPETITWHSNSCFQPMTLELLSQWHEAPAIQGSGGGTRGIGLSSVRLQQGTNGRQEQGDQRTKKQQSANCPSGFSCAVFRASLACLHGPSGSLIPPFGRKIS